MVRQQQALMGTENVELIFTGAEAARVGGRAGAWAGSAPLAWAAARRGSGLAVSWSAAWQGAPSTAGPPAPPPQLWPCAFPCTLPVDAAIREIARVAEEVNTNVDNIGARRLHTILERILEDVSFDAPERAREQGSQVGAWGGGGGGGVDAVAGWVLARAELYVRPCPAP